MDFSKDVFRPSHSSSSISHDTVDHAKMVMACRFGWNAIPENGTQDPSSTSQPGTMFTPLHSSSTDDWKIKRFTPCRGRLYHQLSCSHRIRTDLVEDCGPNCLDPLTIGSTVAFYCHECIAREANEILKQHEAQHNAAYPPIDQMTKEQYEQWYDEHRQLEAQVANERNIYEMNLMSRTRPSNVCSALEASKEEMNFAAEIDSLSLAMMASNDSTTVPLTQTRAQRISLPNDASEQLHWQLNSLALDRGSCGVEYSATQSPTGPTTQAMDEEELWKRPRK